MTLLRGGRADPHTRASRGDDPATGAQVRFAGEPLTEAIILAGGRAQRLGDAARGKPKPLVPVAGQPLVAYQISLLAEAGVQRVLVSCAAGQGRLFLEELSDCPVDVITVEEPRPLGRGGGLRFAAEHADTEEVYALNGDELLDVDLDALLALHRTTRVEATITVARPHSPYGIVELGAGDLVRGFAEAARAPHWVNCGVYVLRREALARFPLTGDHETSTFPALAARSALAAYRHDGAWLTVNTPKDLSQAEAYVLSHPGWPVYTAGSAR